MTRAAQQTPGGPMEAAGRVLEDALEPYPIAQDLARVVLALFSGTLEGRALDGPDAPRRNIDLACFYAVVRDGTDGIKPVVWIRGSDGMAPECLDEKTREFADTITSLLPLPPDEHVPPPSDSLPDFFIVAVVKTQTAFAKGSSYFLYKDSGIHDYAALFWMEHALQAYRSSDISITRTATWDEATTVLPPRTNTTGQRP